MAAIEARNGFDLEDNMQNPECAPEPDGKKPTEEIHTVDDFMRGAMDTVLTVSVPTRARILARVMDLHRKKMITDDQLHQLTNFIARRRMP